MIDLVLVIILIYLMILGLYKGFIDIIFKFIGLAVGLFIAVVYFKPLSNFLSKYFHADEFILDFFAFLFLLFLGLFTFVILNILLSTFLYQIKILKITDKIFGLISGIALYIVILYLLTFLYHKNDIMHDILSSSKIIKWFDQEFKNIKN